MTSGPTSRALIVKLGAIGDVVMAIPAAYALHQRGAEIDWVCGPAIAPLLACYGWIRPIPADDRAILTGSVAERGVALRKLWRSIGRRSYDLCATLYYDSRYKVLTLPVRAKRKVMLSRTDRRNMLVAGRNHADEYARILLPEEDTCRAESIKPLRPGRLPICTLPGRKASVRVALVPGGASNMLRQQTLRRWPVNEYVELARELLRRGYEVVLMGGPDDAWVRPEFADLTSAGLPLLDTPSLDTPLLDTFLLDTIGELSLPEVISACNTCDVVVSHDTGPMHLAGLSTAALVALFGPTDPGSFLPRRDGVRGIWGGEGFACRPCYDGKDFAPCRDNGCMQQITRPTVLRQIDELLAERAAGAMRPQLVVLPSSITRG